MAKAAYGVSVQVSGGPQMSVNGEVELNAHDKLDWKLAGGDSKTLDLQPAGDPKKVSLLLVRSSLQDAGITYKLSDGATDSTELALTTPHVFLGSTVKAIGVAPKQIKLKNALPVDPKNIAVVEILVGRDPSA